MSPLIRIMLGAKGLAPMILVGGALAALGIWVPGATGRVLTTLATLLAALWGALLTIRAHRAMHAAEVTYDTVKHSGLRTHLPIIRRESTKAIAATGHLGTSLRDLHGIHEKLSTRLDALEDVADRTAARTKRITALPTTSELAQKLDDHLGRAASDSPTDLITLLASLSRDGFGSTLLTSAYLRSRLAIEERDITEYVGPQELGEHLARVSGDGATHEWVQLDPVAPIELPRRDLLVIDADSVDVDLLDLRDTLTDGAELWLLGEHRARTSAVHALRMADPELVFTPLPPHIEGLTVLGRGIS